MKKKAQAPRPDDLSFLPPYSEQAKYLLLADQFLRTDPPRGTVVAIDSGRRFKKAHNKEKEEREKGTKAG